jgi:hypothetical protein
MTYNAFFEDPYLWLFAALASAGAVRLAADSIAPATATATPAAAGDDRSPATTPAS